MVAGLLPPLLGGGYTVDCPFWGILGGIAAVLALSVRCLFAPGQRGALDEMLRYSDAGIRGYGAGSACRDLLRIGRRGGLVARGDFAPVNQHVSANTKGGMPSRKHLRKWIL